MNCLSCGDKGIIRVPWTDDPSEDDFAICLCPAGRWYRSQENNGRRGEWYGWQVWSAREQIAPYRVYYLEEIFTPAELAERGFGSQEQTSVDREAALLAAGKTRKTKR